MSTALLHGATPVAAHESGVLIPAGLRRAYLVVCAVLAPLCVPTGPGQSAMLDVLNVAAVCVAVVFLLMPGTRVRLPMLAPAVVVLLGSLFALLQAPSVKLGAFALAQDTYLFAWFIVAVNTVREPRDLMLSAQAWTFMAVAVALVALGQVVAHEGSLGGLLGSRGLRPPGTLYNPNMLADYLVTSLFLAPVALRGRSWLLRALTFGVLVAGLLTTKSNGGMAALGAGLVVFLVVRAVTRRTPFLAVAATTLLVASALLLAAWLNAEWGVGERALASLRSHTFAGRLSHSSESRMHIWTQLQRSYARSPLGIGPGNSGALTLDIADRERPDSFRSKEAHSDYLAYAIERGPLGMLGLVWWTLAGFAAVVAWAGGARALAFPEGSGLRDWTPALAAVLAASAMHSTVIEKLHFRHFWLVLALVCASAALAREAQGGQAQEVRS